MLVLLGLLVNVSNCLPVRVVSIVRRYGCLRLQGVLLDNDTAMCYNGLGGKRLWH